MCELGAFVQKYDSAHLLARYVYCTLLFDWAVSMNVCVDSLAERLAPEDYLAHVKAFKNAGQCEEYKCGQSATTGSTPDVQPEAVSSKDKEGL